MGRRDCRTFILCLQHSEEIHTWSLHLRLSKWHSLQMHEKGFNRKLLCILILFWVARSFILSIPVSCTTSMHVQDDQSTWLQASFSIRKKKSQNFYVKKARKTVKPFTCAELSFVIQFVYLFLNYYLCINVPFTMPLQEAFLFIIKRKKNNKRIITLQGCIS